MVDQSHVFLTAAVEGLTPMTAEALVMLECYATEPLALKETLDSKEAAKPLDEWRSVTTMPGAQSVMIFGGPPMLELPVYNWDYQVHVMI